MLNRFKLLLLIFWVGFGHAVLAAPNFPELTGRIVDQAGLIAADKTEIMIDKLIAAEQKTKAQIVIAVVRSLEGYDIRQYGLELARKWALGQQGKNNGVLLLVAPKERKVSIEIGYGLEGSLTDALAFAIIQEEILPRFKAGNFAWGIEAGLDRIIQGLAGEITAQGLMDEKGSTSIWHVFLAVIVFLLVIIGIMAFNNWWQIKYGDENEVGGRERDSRGGSSHGSSSGFSGGGGSFGGGGASGGW